MRYRLALAAFLTFALRASGEAQIAHLSLLFGTSSTPTTQVRSYVPIVVPVGLPTDTFLAHQTAGLAVGVRAGIDVGARFGIEVSLLQRWSTRAISPSSLGPDTDAHLLQGTVRIAVRAGLTDQVRVQAAGGVSLTHFPSSTSTIGGTLDHSTVLGGSLGLAAFLRVAPHVEIVAAADDAIYQMSFSAYPTINPAIRPGH